MPSLKPFGCCRRCSSRVASFIPSSSPPSSIFPSPLAVGPGRCESQFVYFISWFLIQVWHYGIFPFFLLIYAFTFSQDLDFVVLALFTHCLPPPLHPPSPIIPSLFAVGPGRCELQFISFINWFWIKLTVWYLIFHWNAFSPSLRIWIPASLLCSSIAFSFICWWPGRCKSQHIQW